MHDLYKNALTLATIYDECIDYIEINAADARTNYYTMNDNIIHASTFHNIKLTVREHFLVIKQAQLFIEKELAAQNIELAAQLKAKTAMFDVSYEYLKNYIVSAEQTRIVKALCNAVYDEILSTLLYSFLNNATVQDLKESIFVLTHKYRTINKLKLRSDEELSLYDSFMQEQAKTLYCFVNDLSKNEWDYK